MEKVILNPGKGFAKYIGEEPHKEFLSTSDAFAKAHCNSKLLYRQEDDCIIVLREDGIDYMGIVRIPIVNTSTVEWKRANEEQEEGRFVREELPSKEEFIDKWTHKTVNIKKVDYQAKVAKAIKQWNEKE